MTQPLALPGNIAHLVDALADHHDLFTLLRDTDTLVGGGSILAAHWNNHRRSTDIDLMMPPDAFDAHKDSLRRLIAEIPADDHFEDTVEAQQTTAFSAKGVLNELGDVEIIRDGTGELLRRDGHSSNEPTIGGLKLRAESKEHIIAKKFSRILEHNERDYYDIIWAAYHDQDTLIRAISRHVFPALLTESANQAQTDPRELFDGNAKPVLDPRAPDWKNVLAEVMARIDQYMRTTDETPMSLPTLDIAGQSAAAPRRQGHGR